MSDAPTLWYTRCPVPTATAIAVTRGLLADEFAPDGIEVRSLASSTDPAVHQSHFSHTLPGFLRQGGNIPPLLARSRGTDVRVLGVAWPRTTHPVLVAPSSGIAAPHDLRGRRLSLPHRVDDPVDFWRPTVLRGWEQALALAGLGLDDVELVDVPVHRRFIHAATGGATAASTLWGASGQLGFQREEALALARGDVDAIVSEAGFAVTMRGVLGLRTVVDLEDLHGPAERVNNGIPQTLTVSGRLLDERPDLVARWRARLDEAAAWAAGNPVDATRILAAESALPESLVSEAFGPTAAADLRIGFDDAGLEALQAQHDRLLGWGLLAGPVDIDEYVAPAAQWTAA